MDGGRVCGRASPDWRGSCFGVLPQHEAEAGETPGHTSRAEPTGAGEIDF